MADTAFMTRYRMEQIAQFEQNYSLFRLAATGSMVEERMIDGQSVTFLVAGSSNDTAVTRGTNGNIPDSQDTLVQHNAVLQEWHRKVKRTGFNIFASQGNAPQIMQATVTGAINRKIDDLIIAELNTASAVTSAAATASADMFLNAQAELGEADVPVDEVENMFAAISWKANAKLMQVKEYANAEYVDVKYFDGPARKMRRWCGFNIIVSNRLPGKGTSSETTFMWHRNSMGFACNSGDMEVVLDYDKENDYSFARAKLYMAPKLLQDSGVYKILHNGA